MKNLWLLVKKIFFFLGNGKGGLAYSHLFCPERRCKADNVIPAINAISECSTIIRARHPILVVRLKLK